MSKINFDQSQILFRTIRQCTFGMDFTVNNEISKQYLFTAVYDLIQSPLHFSSNSYHRGFKRSVDSTWNVIILKFSNCKMLEWKLKRWDCHVQFGSRTVNLPSYVNHCSNNCSHSKRIENWFKENNQRLELIIPNIRIIFKTRESNDVGSS